MSRFTDLVTDLATCLCATLDEPSLCFCGVLGGETVIYDRVSFEDCDGGMAWVRVAQMYPAVRVNSIDATLRNCSAGFGLDLELGVMRLAPAMHDDGTPPDEADELAAAEQMINDAVSLRRAVQCCGLLSREDYIIGPTAMKGPLGGVMGVTMTVAVAL